MRHEDSELDYLEAAVALPYEEGENERRSGLPRSAGDLFHHELILMQQVPCSNPSRNI